MIYENKREPNQYCYLVHTSHLKNAKLSTFRICFLLSRNMNTPLARIVSLLAVDSSSYRHCLTDSGESQSYSGDRLPCQFSILLLLQILHLRNVPTSCMLLKYFLNEMPIVVSDHYPPDYNQLIFNINTLFKINDRQTIFIVHHIDISNIIHYRTLKIQSV